MRKSCVFLLALSFYLIFKMRIAIRKPAVFIHTFFIYVSADNGISLNV